MTETQNLQELSQSCEYLLIMMINRYYLIDNMNYDYLIIKI